MAGVTVSFVADPELAARVKEAARIDGITQSQAAARAVASGVLLSAAARRNLRFVLEEGGIEAQKHLAALLARAVTQAANALLQKQLVEQAQRSGQPPLSEEEILNQAMAAISRHENQETPAH